jgi:hypothetical protein
MRQTTLLGLLIVFVVANVRAQGKPVCSLLTANDVSALGATGPGIESAMPTGNGVSAGDTIKMCNWRLPTGGLHLIVAKAPQGLSREALMAKFNESWAMLKTQGWTEEKKEFGGISRSLMTPPAGKQDNPSTTGCLTTAKGAMGSITTLSRTRVPMEKAKALVKAGLLSVTGMPDPLESPTADVFDKR